MTEFIDEERRRGGRPAAGTDPEKRRQIISGADRVFTASGFDAASMSDVAREADVSKATLYVYFPNKEQLFTSVCAERRDRNIAGLIDMLDKNAPLEPTLHAFAATVLRRLSEPFVMAAHRIVIGVAERMPEIGQEFFFKGPQKIAKALAAYLDHHVAAGSLKIEDTYLAAAQFLELSQAIIFRSRLYRAVEEPPTESEIDAVINSAIRVFMAAYGTRDSR